MSQILFLFLTHLGIGIVWTLLFVSRHAGVKFFRFNAGLALALLACAFALRPSGTPAGGAALAGVQAAMAFLLVYWLTVGRALATLRPVLLGGAVLAGAVAIAGQALTLVAPAASLATRALTLGSFATSAALLGGSCTAMVLGHWYLVIPSLDVSHLQGVVKFHLGSLAARLVLVVLVVWLALDGLLTDGFARYIFSLDGVFFWQRVLFGLLGPSLLGWLTWETAKIRSTQSATGILYVDFFTVIVGEVLAKYLFLSTSVPV
jgi:protein NrfD